LAEEMQKGKTAVIEYASRPWPHCWIHEATIDLTGFADAARQAEKMSQLPASRGGAPL
jgi:hypothetical protein